MAEVENTSGEDSILISVLDALHRLEGAVAMQSLVLEVQAGEFRAAKNQLEMQEHAFKSFATSFELFSTAVLSLRDRVSRIEDVQLKPEELSSWVPENAPGNGNGG